MKGLAGKTIAVTGAAGGICTAVCERLVEEGATVYALDRKPAPVGTFVELDVTDPGSVAAALQAVLAGSGRVDGVVAGAGIVEASTPAEDMPLEVYDQVMGVNLRGVFLTAQTFGRQMLEQGAGSIVAISSMSGNHVVNTPQQQCVYNASKAGVTALIKSLAVEWAPRGVRVNAVSPGYIATPLVESRRHLFEGWLRETPIGRLGRPDEVASSIAFLLSDEASFYYGGELVMDGGYTLR
jgi:NAD(P)-dependent dehydrogenase (short-subunit alcohol dehydrogenase family)